MRKLFAVCFLFAFLAVTAAALAQSRTITVLTSDVDQVVSGGFVYLLPDGGCTLLVQYSQPVVGAVGVQAQPHAFNGARCAAVQTALAKAAYLDVGVGDGGLP